MRLSHAGQSGAPQLASRQVWFRWAETPCGLGGGDIGCVQPPQVAGLGASGFSRGHTLGLTLAYERLRRVSFQDFRQEAGMSDCCPSSCGTAVQVPSSTLARAPLTGRTELPQPSEDLKDLITQPLPGRPHRPR